MSKRKARIIQKVAADVAAGRAKPGLLNALLNVLADPPASKRSRRRPR